MTDPISELLKYICKTNRNMTREKLLKELSKSRYSATSLIMTWQNNKKSSLSM